MSIGEFQTRVLDRIAGVPGDCAEFGCYEGETTLQIARETGRRTWAWDTFEGMPDDNYISEIDSSDPPGKWKPNNNPVAAFAASGCDIRPMVGKFSETIPGFTEDVKFAFVHIDCDHYWAYKRVLEFITPRMSPGGLVKLDDYGCCAGAKKATDEWMATTGHTLEPGEFIQF